MRARSILGSGLSFATAVLLVATSAGAQRDPFSSEERRALLAGELVRRDISRSTDTQSLHGGVSWQRVEAPLDSVWQRARDASALTRLIPSLDRAEVIEDHGSSRVVYLHHSYGVAETAYSIVMRFDDEAHELRFHLDSSRPHDIRAGHGHMRLTPYRGGTIVEWGMLVDPGGGLVTQLFAPMLGEWLLLPPRCMRDEVEPGRQSSC